jgi:hypothetical protein
MVKGLKRHISGAFCSPVPVSGSPAYPTSPPSTNHASVEEHSCLSRSEAALKPGRHDEWSMHDGRAFTAPVGPTWGGGIDQLGLDDATKATVSRQNAR